MEKVLAKKLLPLVNDIDKYLILQEYIDNRVETMRNFLENTKDHTKILEVQGSIAELRRFQTLRDQALEGVK
jgi:glutaredoxin-related protein